MSRGYTVRVGDMRVSVADAAALVRVLGRGPAMSDTAYRLLLMKRALARSDAELFGHRPRYLEVARRLAALLLSTDLP